MSKDMPKLGPKRSEYTKHFCKFLLWTTYLLLMAGVVFFVQDVYEEYKSKSTSIKSYVKIQDKLVPPTIVICFNPVVKMSVLKKYNLSLLDLIGFGKIEIKSSLYDEGLYKLGRDFKFSLSWNDQTIDVEDMSMVNESMIKVEEIYTFYNGRCYKITPNFKVKKMDPIATVITMNNSLEPMDLQYISLHFTSEKNSYGIIQGQWLEGKHSLFFEAKLNKSSGFEVYPELKFVKNLPNHHCQPKANTTSCIIKQ